MLLSPLLWAQFNSIQEVSEKLIASDGTANDYLGISVSIYEDTTVVGADGSDAYGYFSGAVYVFNKYDNFWTQTTKLLAQDGQSEDTFGYAVDIYKDMVGVGAVRDDDNGSASGSVYVFMRQNGMWSQQARILASDGSTADHFGVSLSIYESTMVIGAYVDDDQGRNSGSVYVYAYSGGAWSQSSKLIASDGASENYFGLSVSTFEDQLLVGAYGFFNRRGAVYAFSRESSSGASKWSQQQMVIPTDAQSFSYFGVSLQMHGENFIGGAYRDQTYGANAGAAYIFTYSGAMWTRTAKLQSADTSSGDFLGTSVSIHGDTALVSAATDDDKGLDSGSTYVFRREESEWTQHMKLVAMDGIYQDYFGVATRVYESTISVTAYGTDDNGISSGSAYMYSLIPVPTNVPTISSQPTESPSVAPTSPSATPTTSVPSTTPSIGPTAPSSIPTYVPISEPSPQPTRTPTLVPTPQPTMPTSVPTRVREVVRGSGSDSNTEVDFGVVFVSVLAVFFTLIAIRGAIHCVYKWKQRHNDVVFRGINYIPRAQVFMPGDRAVSTAEVTPSQSRSSATPAGTVVEVSDISIPSSRANSTYIELPVATPVSITVGRRSNIDL